MFDVYGACCQARYDGWAVIYWEGGGGRGGEGEIEGDESEEQPQANGRVNRGKASSGAAKGKGKGKGRSAEGSSSVGEQDELLHDPHHVISIEADEDDDEGDVSNGRK